MMMTRMLALVAMTAALLAPAHANEVLVLGSKAQVHRVHTETFTPSGLTQLALTSFGKHAATTEKQSKNVAAIPSVVRTPLLADVFKRVHAYAMIFVHTADDKVLDALHEDDAIGRFPLAAGALDDVPSAVAKAFPKDAATMACVGSGAVCVTSHMPHADVDTATVDAIVAAHPFLQADMKLVEELALAQQLIATLASSSSSKPAFYVISFSDVAALPSADQAAATKLITDQIHALVAQLGASYKSTGVQIVTAAEVAPVTAHRMLVAEVGNSTSGSVAGNSSAANGTTGADTTDALTDDDVAEYQIVMWTAILLVVALAMIMVPMSNMNTKHDSLLYAKFTTSSARKFD